MISEDCGLCEDGGDGYVTLITKYDPACTVHDPAEHLEESRVDAALRRVIAELDYDLHKGIERDEETGEDRYSEVTENFFREYRKAVSS